MADEAIRREKEADARNMALERWILRINMCYSLDV